MNVLTLAFAASLTPVHAELFSHEGFANRHLVLGRFAFDALGGYQGHDESGTVTVTSDLNYGSITTQSDLEAYFFDDEEGSNPEFFRTGVSYANVDVCRYRKSLAKEHRPIRASDGGQLIFPIYEGVRPRWWHVVIFKNDCEVIGDVKISARYVRTGDNNVDKGELSYNERYMDTLHGLFWVLWTTLLVGQIISMSCRARTSGCEGAWKNGFAPLMLVCVSLYWLYITCELSAYAGIAGGSERDTRTIRAGYAFFLLGRTAFITLVIYLIRGEKKGVGMALSLMIIIEFVMQCTLWLGHASGYTESNPDYTFFYHTGQGWMCVAMDCAIFVLLVEHAITAFTANEPPHSRAGRTLISFSFIPWFLLTPFLTLCTLAAPTYDIDVAFQAPHLVFTFITQALAVISLGFQSERCFSGWNSAKYAIHAEDPNGASRREIEDPRTSKDPRPSTIGVLQAVELGNISGELYGHPAPHHEGCISTAARAK